MKVLKSFMIVLAVAAVTASCSSKFDTLLASNDVDAKYKAAFEYFNAGKFRKAANLFESLSVMTTGTERDDSVQYYWGLSNYRYKDYYTAEANFSKFVNNFPRSIFAEQARFYRIDCLYRSTLRYELDQIPTYSALNAMEEYLRDYPNSEWSSECRSMAKVLNDRLDKKAFENARLYYKMEDFRAAKVAFKNILKTDPENIYREDVMYYVAMSSYKYAKNSIPEKQKERYMDFMDEYLNFIGEIPDSPYTKELNAMYRRAQRAIGKAVGESDTDSMRDRDFEKERKALQKK